MARGEGVDFPGAESGNAASSACSFASAVCGNGGRAGPVTPSRAWRASLANWVARTRSRRVVHRVVDASERGLDGCGYARSALVGSRKRAWKRERKGGSSG